VSVMQLWIAIVALIVVLLVVINIRYARFLKTLSPTELAVFRDEEDAELQVW